MPRERNFKNTYFYKLTNSKEPHKVYPHYITTNGDALPKLYTARQNDFTHLPKEGLLSKDLDKYGKKAFTYDFLEKEKRSFSGKDEAEEYLEKLKDKMRKDNNNIYFYSRKEKAGPSSPSIQSKKTGFHITPTQQYDNTTDVEVNDEEKREEETESDWEEDIDEPPNRSEKKSYRQDESMGGYYQGGRSGIPMERIFNLLEKNLREEEVKNEILNQKYRDLARDYDKLRYKYDTLLRKYRSRIE